jgi:hypothetical protein
LKGIHFRFSNIVGANVGRGVADYDLSKLRSLGL